ncbi:helix-turn-helix transcriptional regulator [Roseivivax isoporae]|uniref:Transcriptional regulator n=1 Tax=Roseivivax isoporae LMG 25204 TaxID=1449351 RepID=X7F1B3_9RHOB|nr:helix-turn-helix transcriptional regulator [Roseivivax isoporae]ETX26712.1 transcriptional regulator [Roseivivax isoporae LMG 25204]
MARDTLTGSRIRERRIMAGLKQAELAREANISPSYLNLIEHNRRRIGGKLLLDLAAILDVEPTALTEGAEATLVAALREAASEKGRAGPRAAVEIDRVDEFAGRFPGWAGLLADTHRRTVALERTVETLTDRLTHDPHLAAALHEMLSTVTAIRAASAILAEPGEIPPDWQRRFHRNIHEDSARLAETSRTLVRYLDAADDASSEATAPQEEVDAVLAQAGHRFPAIETGATGAGALADALGADMSGTARRLLARHLRRYEADARRLPLATIGDALQAGGDADPFRLAGALGADPAQVMRRLAALPPDLLPDPCGLAICDASGALTYRKPLADFPMPRFGAGCPLWPLYQALSRPMTATRLVLEQAGSTGRRFRADAIAVPHGPAMPDRPALFEAHMLVVPDRAETAPDPLPVGVSCRICPRTGCAGRREPSILPDAAREEF